MVFHEQLNYTTKGLILLQNQPFLYKIFAGCTFWRSLLFGGLFLQPLREAHFIGTYHKQEGQTAFAQGRVKTLPYRGVSHINYNLNSKKHPFPGAFLIYCSISCLFLPQAQVET